MRKFLFVSALALAGFLCAPSDAAACGRGKSKPANVATSIRSCAGQSLRVVFRPVGAAKVASVAIVRRIITDATPTNPAVIQTRDLIPATSLPTRPACENGYCPIPAPGKRR